MGSELRQTDTASYTWTSKELTLEHADPATAASAQALRVEHAPPGVLRGIEQFTGLGVLEVIADAPLDLAPLCLCAGLTELYAVELELRANVTGEKGLAQLPAFRDLYLNGDAEHLPAVVAGFAWDQIGSPSGLWLIARGGAFAVDVTPLGALASLVGLVGEGLVLGPRDISGEAFAALLPPHLYSLYSAHADEGDKERLAAADAVRPPAPDGTLDEPGFFSWDKVDLGRSAVEGDPAAAWWQDPEDGSWTLVLDLVPILGGDPDDGEVNYRAEALVQEELRRERPALGDRVEFDTTAEALFVILPEGHADDRDHIDQAVRTAVTALRQPH